MDHLSRERFIENRQPTERCLFLIKADMKLGKQYYALQKEFTELSEKRGGGGILMEWRRL